MNSSNEYYVYLISRPDGTPCYVGKGKGARWKRHAQKTCNAHLHAIYAKHDGVLPIVKLREHLTEEEAFSIEKATILRLGRIGLKSGPLVNFTDGGEGPSGYRRSPEAIEKTRQANIGRKRSPETIEKMRQAATGRKLSSEAIENARQTNTGRKRSPEAIEKTRQAHIGRKRSQETIEKIRQAHIGMSATEDTKKKISSSQLKLTDSQVLEIVEKLRQGESQSSLGRYYGVSRGTIYKIKNGKRFYMNDVSRSGVAPSKTARPITPEIVLEVLALLKIGESKTCIAQKCGMSAKSVYNIAHGKRTCCFNEGGPS